MGKSQLPVGLGILHIYPTLPPCGVLVYCMQRRLKRLRIANVMTAELMTQSQGKDQSDFNQVLGSCVVWGSSFKTLCNSR